jgi:hypothetical protein
MPKLTAASAAGCMRFLFRRSRDRRGVAEAIVGQLSRLPTEPPLRGQGRPAQRSVG